MESIIACAKNWSQNNKKAKPNEIHSYTIGIPVHGNINDLKYIKSWFKKLKTPLINFQPELSAACLSLILDGYVSKKEKRIIIIDFGESAAKVGAFEIIDNDRPHFIYLSENKNISLFSSAIDRVLTINKIQQIKHNNRIKNSGHYPSNIKNNAQKLSEYIYTNNDNELKQVCYQRPKSLPKTTSKSLPFSAKKVDHSLIF